VWELVVVLVFNVKQADCWKGVLSSSISRSAQAQASKKIEHRASAQVAQNAVI
jgi:hypothetical protein